ncbi:unnamed protein product [Malus baccata var. baccata]
MELIGFIQVFNIIIIAIGTLLYMCCRPFSSSSSATDSAAVADDDDADIPPFQEKYDVFISFRGEDTRRTFTSHLHSALLAKKITTYIDDKLKRGDEIKPALRKAIEESELSVIIFSKDYASSTWCLDELVHILECKEKHGQLVIPIFYDTLPSDVRRQRGSYALDLLEQRFENRIDKVRKWRAALTNAADMSGFDSKNYRKDADLVKDVVEDIWTKLCRETSCDLEEYVGIESRIKQIESLLGIHSQDTCITVGIWGMGGLGKTTLAETVFHRLSSKFEGSCFLRNVTEREQKDGLDHLEKTLLKEILKEEGLSIGSTRVRKRLGNTKVLIVLDDVSSSMQMERLAGNLLRYGTGSRIIFTSRDKSTLGQAVEEGKIYAIGGLKWDDAIQLFCSRAFKNNSTCGTDYMGLAIKALDYAGGVPLALILLGSSFRNCKSKEAWEEELEKLKEFPNENIQRVLRLSYDGLGRYEKEIFLDIACFHKRRDVDEVEKVLAIRGRFAATGIRVLVDMSLISIDSRWDGDRTIRMHDLLEEMGRTIVQEQRIEDPHKGNRLFKDEDVYRVLKSNKETPNVEAVLVNWSKIQEPPLNRADFKKMSNLRLLIVDNFDEFGNCCKFTASLDLPDSLCYLYWPHYPLESLPSNFSSENLLELHMPNGKVKKLWEEDQILVNLEVIDLHDSQYLIEAPNLSGSLKIVNINLSGCARLVQIPLCFQHLHKLTHLRFGHCTSLKYLPEMPGSIKYLDLQSSGIKKLPKSVWSNENISYLNTSHCKDLEKLPSNMCKLKVSGCFNLDGCTSLREFSELPRDISKLSLVDCKRLEKFPEILEPMEHMVSLSLRGTAVEMLPSSVGNLISLQTLDLSGCKHLVSLPTNICKLKYLEELNLSGCSELEKFPEILEPMEHLVSLSLQGTAVEMLPSSIGNLISLQTLDLSGCKHLVSLPTNICKLKYLEELNLSGCSELEKFPEILEPMEHLVSLSLQGTAVGRLPSSIGNLIRLQTLYLSGCKHLKDVETSLDLYACYPNKHLPFNQLKRLYLYYCRELEKLPFTYTGFLSLEELDLSDSGILEIPNGLVCSTSLKRIYLSGTKIRSIPASIKRASRLSELNLVGCKQLQSLPELPALCNVRAQGCTALKTQASSRTALTCPSKK